MVALQLTGHMVQSQPSWSRRDIHMTWTLILICYYSSSRVGDLLSTRVNTATDKILYWSDVSFDLSGKRIVIYLRSPKTKVFH